MLKRYIFSALLLLVAACVSCATANQKKQAELHYMLGLSRWQNGQYQEAYVEFNKALMYRDNYKEVYNSLGDIYMKWGDLGNAEKSFRKAIGIDHDYSDAYNSLCYLEYREKKYGQAVLDCQKALSNPLYETPEKAFFNLGLSYLKLSKFDKAINALRQATIRMGDFYPAYYQLALAYNAKGDYGEAASALQTAVRLDPRFKGDMAKAENTFRRGGAVPGGNFSPELVEIFKY